MHATKKSKEMVPSLNKVALGKPMYVAILKQVRIVSSATSWFSAAINPNQLEQSIPSFSSFHHLSVSNLTEHKHFGIIKHGMKSIL